MKTFIIAFVLLSTFLPTATKNTFTTAVNATHTVVQKSIGIIFQTVYASEG